MPAPRGRPFICLWSGMWVYQGILALRQMYAWKCKRLIPPQRVGPARRWWDSEFISRVPEFPQGLLFKGKLVCLQLDPWATFDSCSKNNKTDGQNRFWGLRPNCHPQWNLKKAWSRRGGAAPTCHYVLPLTPEREPKSPCEEGGNCHHVLFLCCEFSLVVRKINRRCVFFPHLKLNKLNLNSVCIPEKPILMWLSGKLWVSFKFKKYFRWIFNPFKEKAL